MKKKYYISVAIILSIVFAGLRFLNFGEIWRLIKEIPTSAFALILLPALIMTFLKILRYRFINNFRGIELTYWQSIKVFVAGQTASALPAGETMRAYLVKDETDASFFTAVEPIIILTIFDASTTASLFILGSIIFNRFLILALIFGFLNALFLAAIINKKLLRTVLRPFGFFKKGRELKKRARKARNSLNLKKYFKNNFKSIKMITGQIVLSLLINLSGGFLIFQIANAFSIHLNYFLCIFIYLTSIILQVIGIVPLGLGVMEGGLTGMLVLYGVPLSTSAAIVIIFRLVTFTFTIILGSVFMLAFYPKVIFKKKRK